jgi:hypothetical protein
MLASLVWPMGLACMVGVAIGFGVGYTLGIRDRASVSQTTRERAAAPAAPVAVAPPRDFTESTVGGQPTAAPQAGSEARLPPEEAPVVPFSGCVVVQSMPAGTRVRRRLRSRVTPATVTDLGRGEHRLRIVRDGYTTAERRIVLSSSRPSSSLIVPLAKTPVSPKPTARQSADAALASPKPGTRPSAEAGLASPKPAATAVAEVGSLLIESRPAGANVFMDGRAVGRTPVNLPDVKADDHAVRLESADIGSGRRRSGSWAERRIVSGRHWRKLTEVEAILALEDGTWFKGTAAGAQGEATGEVVFNTSMTGYQEIWRILVPDRSSR